MNLERELAKHNLAWRKGFMGADHEAAGDALYRFICHNLDALRALAKGPPELDGVPTVPGWYEYRYRREGPGDQGVADVRLLDGQMMAVFSGGSRGPTLVEMYPGTWYGPIPEPEGP